MLSPPAKHLVVRNRMGQCAEMSRFAHHDTFTLSRYSVV
jgi:hypothetical protein